MKILLFLVLLLQTIPAQNDSILRYCLNRTASELNIPVKDIQSFFNPFFEQNNPAALTKDSDSTVIHYFNVVFSSPLEYNYSTGTLNVNFNYLVEDQYCNNSNRNGIVLLEQTDRTPAKGKVPEKINKIFYVLIPDKCSTTRFYNAQQSMFCDNKKQFILEFDEGKKLAETLSIRVGISLLSTTTGNYYEKNSPAQKDYPVETNVKEYILRCCIRSITFFNGREVLDSFVSVK